MTDHNLIIMMHGLISFTCPLMSTMYYTGNKTSTSLIAGEGGKVTPQQALLQTMAAMHQKVGICILVLLTE